MVAPTSPPVTREEFAERLLKGSVKKSYAPIVDIDWDAPLDPDKFFLPPNVVSLYGTPQWDAMTREQQIELSRQELISILSAGIWFENILNQALLRDLMHKNPTSNATHYALTELGDETRHMVMFGKTIARIGGIPVRPRLHQRIVINSLPFAFRGSVLWAAALVGEEIFDALQRQIMEDPELQPIVQRLMRIHVTEEARHIQFARDGLRKSVPTMPWYRRMLRGQPARCGRAVLPDVVHPADSVQPCRSRRSRDAPGGAVEPALPPGVRDGVRAALRVLRRGRADGPARAADVAAGRIPVTVIVIRDAADKARFDAVTEMWTVTTPDGRSDTARTVIDARRSDDDAVAVHGLPNYFRIPGPDVERQLRYVDRCLHLLDESGCTRMEARSRIVVRRWRPRRVAGRFQLSGSAPGDDDVYDGPATLTLGGPDIEVRARLAGHLDAIDGRYHWRGTVIGDLPVDALKGQRTVTLSIDSHSAQARLAEQTPWGGYTVVGAGAPPFPIDRLNRTAH